MNVTCPECGATHYISNKTALLFRFLFAKTIPYGEIFFLCDNCGDKVLKNYKDPYGIGV